MYYIVEETKDATNFYAVEVRKWCLCLMQGDRKIRG